MRPTFLPLIADAAAAAEAPEVSRRAAEADAAADVCWASLLGGCARAKRWGLDTRLRQLSEAACEFAGTVWWFNDGSAYRQRVAHAQGRIEEAISEADGPEFARALAGYDHALASAVIAVHARRGAPAPRMPAEWAPR